MLNDSPTDLINWIKCHGNETEYKKITLKGIQALSQLEQKVTLQLPEADANARRSNSHCNKAIIHSLRLFCLI